MQHDEFIGRVQSRAGLSSRGEAEVATRATLETLGEWLPEPVATKLAAQLPQDLSGFLNRTITIGDAGSGNQGFGLDEFSSRVAEREAADVLRAVFHAQVVLEVLEEATQGTVRAKVHDLVSEELRPPGESADRTET